LEQFIKKSNIIEIDSKTKLQEYSLKKYKRNLVSRKVNYSFIKIKKKLLSLGAKKVDYVEIIDLETLKKPKKNKAKFNLFFAFYIGKIRFIDNF